MQKFTTNQLIKNFILNNLTQYSFQPFYQYSPNKYKFGFSNTYKIKNNPNYKKCNRHKFILNFTIKQTNLKNFLNQLQSQYPNTFKYKIKEITNYQTGELICLHLTTYNLFN